MDSDEGYFVAERERQLLQFAAWCRAKLTNGRGEMKIQRFFAPQQTHAGNDCFWHAVNNVTRLVFGKLGKLNREQMAKRADDPNYTFQFM